MDTIVYNDNKYSVKGITLLKANAPKIELDTSLVRGLDKAVSTDIEYPIVMQSEGSLLALVKPKKPLSEKTKGYLISKVALKKAKVELPAKKSPVTNYGNRAW